VRTILRRLEQKGYLQHGEQGRAYVYRAAEPARSLAARAVRQIIDRFCKGSVEELVSGMVEARVLSKGELDRLEEFVREQRGEK
jgi:predicted transcriptional regulator